MEAYTKCLLHYCLRGFRQFPLKDIKAPGPAPLEFDRQPCHLSRDLYAPGMHVEREKYSLSPPHRTVKPE